MIFVDVDNPPEFYQRYVEEIQQRVRTDAALEFECIWQCHEKTGQPRFQLTDIVSDKINTLNKFVQKSSLYENETVKQKGGNF